MAKIKIKKKTLKAVIFVIIIVFLLLIGVLILKIKQKNEENKFNSGFFEDNNCSCLEREKLICKSGFELDSQRKICIRGNEITNVILRCSKYDCSGIIYELNQGIDRWEKKQ